MHACTPLLCHVLSDSTCIRSIDARWVYSCGVSLGKCLCPEGFTVSTSNLKTLDPHVIPQHMPSVQHVPPLNQLHGRLWCNWSHPWFAIVQQSVTLSGDTTYTSWWWHIKCGVGWHAIRIISLLLISVRISCGKRASGGTTKTRSTKERPRILPSRLTKPHFDDLAKVYLAMNWFPLEINFSS